MPNDSFLLTRIKKCLLRAKPELANLDPLDENKHLYFDYGLDSLGYEKFAYLLEEEFRIRFDPEIRKSGYFSSLSGVYTLLTEEMGISK